MHIGIVKWFNHTKGFGFLTCECCESDIFAHFSAIETEGFRFLKSGQKVKFRLEISERGAIASNIIPFSE